MLFRSKVLSALNVPSFNAPSLSTAKVGATPSPTVAAASSGGGNTGSSTNVVPTAIYIDGKKIGEILDPRYKQMIDDSLKNIGSKTVPINSRG